MDEQQLKDCEHALRHEFQFFKDLCVVGVDILKLMDHMRFMRSLDVKTMCQEGELQEEANVYIIFSGECEIQKTRNKFKLYGEDGNEIV